MIASKYFRVVTHSHSLATTITVVGAHRRARNGKSMKEVYCDETLHAKSGGKILISHYLSHGRFKYHESLWSALKMSSDY